MVKGHNSIKLHAAETCRSDQAATQSCNYCKKQGMPILIARYAVRGTESPSFMPTMKASSRVANAMPWDLRPNRKIKIKHSLDEQAQTQEKFEYINLPSFSEYILRRPRQGYIYIYDEIYGGQWKGYYIDTKGYIKSEILSEPTSLLNGEEFSCNSNPENVAFGSIITLPHPEINRTIYLAYVEAAWSFEWRNKIAQDESWRKNHMQSFEMSTHCSGPDIYPIEEIENLIFEYSSDILMSQLDSNNALLSTIFNTIKGNRSIAKYTKTTIINHAKNSNYPAPFILALHDNIGITLHLNELRVAQQLMLQDKMQDPEFKRRHLCVTSLMSMEASIRSSPYSTPTYDGIPISKSFGKKMWEFISPDELTTKNSIPDDFHVEGVAGGKTYKQCQQQEAEERERDYRLSKEDPLQYSVNHLEDRDQTPAKKNTEILQDTWDAQADAQEQITKEFYQSKYFDYNQYYHDKSDLLSNNDKIKKISGRLDYDYCWWLSNKLSSSFELYDINDLYHRAVVTSLLSRALTGGIIAQASRDLWEKFHNAPEEDSERIIIKGILGWNDELAKKLQEYLATDKPGPIKNKKKPKTIFEEYYIKEIGKTVKKVNSLYKDRNKIIDKDFSKKALNAFKTMHESAQEIADTLESTHKALITSEQYIAENGLTEENRTQANTKTVKLSQYEFHSSGLRVTQFKTLRIMHAHRIACMDIVAHVKSLEDINNKILKQSALLDKLEASYARISKQIFVINNIERHILFFERPIVDFFDDITRIKAQKLSDNIKNIKGSPIVSTEKSTNSNGEEIIEKSIKYNNSDTHLYSNSTVEQVFVYSDNDAILLEESVKQLSKSEIYSQESLQSERLDNEILRHKYNKILREEYTKSMNKDFRDRWVGRLSRLAIYWGFIESFKKLCKNPTDLQAWWKMSSSIVFVTQSYFDIWEQSAKQRLAYLNAAQKAEGTVPEYLVTGSKMASAEVQFAKLWSKRIGVIGSIISIIDGLCELAHAKDMDQHGELRSDVLITEVKGWLSVASGVIGIMLIETVCLGGILAIFAFAIALWLLPSTETLFPLGVRNWLRRSLFKLSYDDARYLPFKTWEEEQASFKTMLKGIEIDTAITEGLGYYRLTIAMNSPTEISTNIKYSLGLQQNLSFSPVFEYGVKINYKNTKYEINAEEISNKRTSIPLKFNGIKNPIIEQDTHTVKIKVTLNIEKNEKNHKKEFFQLLIKQSSNEEIIDSYIFGVE